MIIIHTTHHPHTTHTPTYTPHAHYTMHYFLFADTSLLASSPLCFFPLYVLVAYVYVYVDVDVRYVCVMCVWWCCLFGDAGNHISIQSRGSRPNSAHHAYSLACTTNLTTKLNDGMRFCHVCWLFHSMDRVWSVVVWLCVRVWCGVLCVVC